MPSSWVVVLRALSRHPAESGRLPVHAHLRVLSLSGSALQCHLAELVGSPALLGKPRSKPSHKPRTGHAGRAC